MDRRERKKISRDYKDQENFNNDPNNDKYKSLHRELFLDVE